MSDTKRILVFGASSSSTSINKTLAIWASKQLENIVVDLIDLRDYDMPVFSVDRERENGIHPLAKEFKDRLNKADGVIISFAEHNASYSTAFKNVFDWMSRIGKPIWSDKPMLLLSTSNGKRGGKSVLSSATNSFPHQGAEVAASLSLPSYSENFDKEKGIVTNKEWIQEFETAKQAFIKAIDKS